MHLDRVVTLESVSRDMIDVLVCGAACLFSDGPAVCFGCPTVVVDTHANTLIVDTHANSLSGNDG